ncbi:TPA: hypothetical protein DEP90_00030, partial [Patescibacteria group bacterium]|nr:hypothetical protein [Patescibacteria group bacterium]
APAIEVTKTAGTLVLPVPGGNVIFTVVVINNSQESVTLTTLTDDIYGDLDGLGTCATGGIITANGGTYSCAFTGVVNGTPGLYTDIVTAIATDNDGTSDTDTDDAVVELEGGKIIVEKLTTLPDLSYQSFKFDSSWGDNFFLINDQSIDSGWLAPGSYSVAEIKTPGWELTSTSCISSIGDIETAGSLELDPGETITCTFTNTRDTGSLTVYKVIDEDGDLTTTDDQTMGIGWEFDVDGSGDDTSNPSPLTTDIDDGKVRFTDLKTGSYTVREYPIPGYEILSATCGAENGSLDGNAMYSVDVNKDGNTICTFYNTPNGVVEGYKWNDINMNGKRDCEYDGEGPRPEDIIKPEGEMSECEPLLSGWTINLYRSNGEGFDETPLKSMDTDGTEGHFGWYWFDHLFPGTYKVCEVQKEGWNQSYPNNEDDNCHIINLPEEDVLDRLVSANYVVGPEYNFGNYVIPAELEITKENDSPTEGLLTGSSVLYTLHIHLPYDDLEEGTYLINNVKVIDILPEGFEYVSGSWTAKLENSGGTQDLKALGITGEPAYNGTPGVWELGNLIEGDIITLTYAAKINLLNEPGLYKDIAFVQGDSILAPEDTGNVLGESYNPGYINTEKLGFNFIGTKVLIIEPMEEAGEVLGAAIELPATGAEAYITLGALISMILGFVLLLFGKKKKISALLITLVVSLGLFTLLKPIQTYANNQTQVSIRLEQPKTGVTDREFEITYVALSIPMQPLTIQCKYSTDGATFIDFDTPKTAYSDSCKVDESIITSSGTYYFKAVASTSGGGAESEEVTVKISDAPSTVTEYSKTEGTCTYTLKFKSTTSKVQIFRSDKQPFTADDSTLLTKPSLSVTPNVLTTYTDTLPTCDKEYYYAIRAVDEFNNVSTMVTDDIITIIPGTTTTTVTVNGETETGQIAGEETTAEPDGTGGNGEEEMEEEEGDVAGEETTKEDEENGEEGGEEDSGDKSFWDEYKYVIIALGVIL